MRSLAAALCAVALMAPAAAADSPIQPHKGDRPFWDWLADPHGVEIRVILDKVRENRQHAQGQATFTSSYQPAAAALRARALDDALGMLRYARRLAPESADVLLALGEVAAERGAIGEAIDALESYLAVHGAEDVPPYVHTLLGRAYALQGRWAAAERALESALPGADPEATWRLAEVYMERGRLADAIDLLIHAPAISSSPQLQLALAVAYDRDEQIARARAALEKLAPGRNMAAAMTAVDHSGDVPVFTPAADWHYYRAMLYQAAGHLADARAEWLAYARAEPQARYRKRARAHLRAIDARLPGSNGVAQVHYSPRRPLHGQASSPLLERGQTLTSSRFLASPRMCQAIICSGPTQLHLGGR